MLVSLLGPDSGSDSGGAAAAESAWWGNACGVVKWPGAVRSPLGRKDTRRGWLVGAEGWPAVGCAVTSLATVGGTWGAGPPGPVVCGAATFLARIGGLWAGTYGGGPM